MNKRITISIMPTINGIRRPDLYATPTVKLDMPDEEVGEVMGDFFRTMQSKGVDMQGDLIELQLRIY